MYQVWTYDQARGRIIWRGENKVLGIEDEVEIECPKCNGAMRKLK